MKIALIVGFSLLLAIGLAAGYLIYAYFTYSKNRIFSKTKYSISWIVVLCCLICLLLTSGIMFTLDAVGDYDPIEYSSVFLGLNWSCFILCVVYLIMLLIIPSKTNKNKIEYENILKIDYSIKIKLCLSKIDDVEKCKAKLSAKHNKYYVSMLSFYENILRRAKDTTIPMNEKLADIVTFNDAFTYRWSNKVNNYQQLLTYQFCEVLQKIS